MGNAILLQFYEQKQNPRQLGGRPGSGEETGGDTL